MSNKGNLQALILRIQELEVSMKGIRDNLTIVTATLPENDIEGDVEFFIKLKYDEITHDPSTWENIKQLPVPVLVKWEQRLWFERKTNLAYRSTGEEELKSLVGDKGYKAIEHWFWHIDDFIKSIICDPSSTDKHLRNLAECYNKGSLASKKYMKKYFDMLDNEIKTYENMNKK